MKPPRNDYSSGKNTMCHDLFKQNQLHRVSETEEYIIIPVNLYMAQEIYCDSVG